MIGEYHDGGYWLVVPVIIDEHGTKTVPNIPGGGTSVWYGSDHGIYEGLAAVRTPNPVDVPEALPGFTAADLLPMLGMASVPFTRVGGK